MTAATPKKQQLPERIFWFVLGGCGSALFNTSLFRIFHQFLGWPQPLAYALSLLLMTIVLFLWSYFVNFRTSRIWHDCIWRYLTTVALCYTLNYVIGLSGIKKWGTSFWTTFLVVAIVQSMTGAVKFLLYHFWVFGHGKPPETETA